MASDLHRHDKSGRRCEFSLIRVERQKLLRAKVYRHRDMQNIERAMPPRDGVPLGKVCCYFADFGAVELDNLDQPTRDIVLKIHNHRRRLAETVSSSVVARIAKRFAAHAVGELKFEQPCDSERRSDLAQILSRSRRVHIPPVKRAEVTSVSIKAHSASSPFS